MHVLRTSRPPGWATQTSAMEVHHGKVKIWLASREVCGTDMISTTSWSKSLTDMESWSLCHSWKVEVCGTDMIKNRFKVCVCAGGPHELNFVVDLTPSILGVKCWLRCISTDAENSALGPVARRFQCHQGCASDVERLPKGCGWMGPWWTGDFEEISAINSDRIFTYLV